MLTTGSYLLSLGLVFGWLAIFVLSKHLPELRSATRLLPHPTRHSITEMFFEGVGTYSSHVGSKLSYYLSQLLLMVLSKFLPWFRQITRSSVVLLERLNNRIMGKLDIRSNRDAASPYIRDIRDNADNQESG